MNIQLKKSLGQNFLRNDFDAKRISDGWGDLSDKDVLEIGPGDGRLTRHLLKLAKRVIAVEIDKRWSDKLWRQYEGHPGFVLRNDDITQIDWSSEVLRPFVVFGNLPYHLTSKILFQSIDYIRKQSQITSVQPLLGMVVMLQKEVADRAISKPGSSDYGILPTFLQMFGFVESILTLPPNAFIPPPKVYSTVIKITFNSSFVPIQNWELLNAMVRVSYNGRRKMLRNTLNAIRPPLPENLDTFGVDLNRRPQTLSPSEWIAFSNKIDEKSNWTAKKPK